MRLKTIGVYNKMLSHPLVSFHTVAADGVEHEASVFADDHLFVVTTDVFITDAVSPEAYVTVTGETDSPADLPPYSIDPAAARLMAGYRALQLHLEFEDGYGRIARRFKKRDDGASDEGVPL